MFNCMNCGHEITEDFYQNYGGKCYECIQKECLNYGLNYSVFLCIGVVGLLMFIFFFMFFLGNFIGFLIDRLILRSLLFPGIFFLLGLSFFLFSVKGLRKHQKLNFHQK